MPKTLKNILFVLLCNLFVLVTNNCFATIESIQQTLNGPFTVGQTFILTDAKYVAGSNWSIQDAVSLRVLDNVLITTPFLYSVQVDMDFYNDPNSNTPSFTSSVGFAVSYTPGQGVKYLGQLVYNYQGASKIVARVASVNNNGFLPPPAGSVQLSSRITVNRNYPFQPANSLAAAYINNVNNLQINWNYIQGAEEYDVEWTTINNGNANFPVILANINTVSNPDNATVSTALANAFRNNASRVTTDLNSYNISLNSTDSLILVRIRQAQYDKTTGVRVTGNWDYKNGTKYAIWKLNWTDPSTNWQYSAAFAEEGKKKEVISYFDGSLRGRQTVTINNSDNIALAQENIYDEFGRATASILPAPYKEASGLPYLHYIKNFNVAAANAPYTFANVVGGTPSVCELNPDPLSTLSGASRYYSPQNDFLSNAYNKFIPNAGGFPLSVTQYTNDNTGRIKSQGGVGLAFQPGKSGSSSLSKTTRYFYGKPEQWELDQLFGNDVGYAEHYLKNMVIDPNGQISLSYLNASGKTIATALTGKSPTTLDTLTSYQSTKKQSIHILKPEQFIYNSTELKLSATTTYLASVAGQDTLKYSIQKLINTYPGGAFQICSNCYYLMNARVTDDCGNIVASTSAPVQIGSTTSNCNDAGVYNGTLLVPVAQPGEYNISIEFAFDNNIIQNFTDNFIVQGKQNGYLEQQFNYIKKRYLDTLDVSGCYADCHTCTTMLGSQANFVQMLKDKFLALDIDATNVASTAFSDWANGLFTTLKAKCTASLASCTFSPCASVQDQMLLDVSPGGQYALFTSAPGPLEPEINVLTQIQTGQTQPNWRIKFPVLPSNNAEYIANLVTKSDNSVTSPNDASFTLSDLVTYWKPEWASRFLSYHPEICKLNYCINNAQYKGWDMLLQEQINTAADVPSIPTGGAPITYSAGNAYNWLLNADPFFKTGAPGNAYLTQMGADLQNYSTNVIHVPAAETTVKSLGQFVDYILYCYDNTLQTNTYTGNEVWKNCTPVATCRVPDKEWVTYRDYYLQLKEKYYGILRDASCGTACPVGQPVAINLPGTCPAVTDFTIKPYNGSDTPCSGSQTIIIGYQGLLINKSTTISLYYPSAVDNATLTHTVLFNVGENQKSICVPLNIPPNSIVIKLVSPTEPTQNLTENTSRNFALSATSPQTLGIDILNYSTGVYQSVASAYWGGNTGSTGRLGVIGFWPTEAQTKTYNSGASAVEGDYFGFDAVVTFPESKVYYFVMAGVQAYSYVVDCTNNSVGRSYQISTNQYFAADGGFVSAGKHLVHVNYKLGVPFLPLAQRTAGFEIYSNTFNELVNANSTGTGLNVIFSTKNFVGNNNVYSYFDKDGMFGTISAVQPNTNQTYHYTKPDGTSPYYNFTFCDCGPLLPPVNPPAGCPEALTIKTPRFPAYVYNGPIDGIDGPTLVNQANTDIKAQAADICNGAADTWISNLQPGLNSLPNSATVTAQLRAALIATCTGGGDQAHPMGASSLPSPIAGVYNDFGSAIKAIALGGGAFTPTLNPWLIDGPYPYNVVQQSVSKTITSTDASTCAILQSLNQSATGKSMTLYNYLVATYKTAMTLTQADLDVLQKSCNNCRFIMDRDVAMPVFLDPGAKGCISGSEYQAAKTDLNNQFGGALTSSSANYQDIFSNFMNQRWGLTLIYDDYANFETALAADPNAILCNIPPVTTRDIDPYDCVKNAMARAVSNGKADYDAYIAEQRKLFRTSYINVCKLAKPDANLSAVEQIYHYTLYYYDQADNLVRTIPPEGVTLFDNSKFKDIDIARDNDTLAYAYNGPTTNANKTTAFTTLSTTLAAAQGAVEMWLYNNGIKNYHVVQVTPDNKYLFQAAISGTSLNVDIYPLTKEDATSITLTAASEHYRANIASIPLTPFTHVVIQGATLGATTGTPQIYVNGKATTVTLNPTPPAAGFTITGGATAVTYPDSTQTLKHLRLYTHLLSTATITTNAADTHFNTADAAYAGWYRFNIPANGSLTTVDASTTDETTLYGNYNAHVLPTTYAYNATNQVTLQNSPDGGTNRFWYDLLSRLVASQNAKQLAAPNDYSYTTYDLLGRITEVGQKNQSTINLGVPHYLPADSLAMFGVAGSNSQITHTYYDIPAPTVGGNSNGIAALPGQSFLRKRVAASTFAETQNAPAVRATYYNYDLDGNVKTLWQQINGLYQNSDNSGLKRIDYEYDLVSGKVNFIRYQDGQPDAFYYRYRYDAENRLVDAWAGPQAMVDTLRGSDLLPESAKQDAYYYYYLHGPLRRLELGDATGKVQGIDYAYTLQGWLKGVNSTATTATADMGLDGSDLSHLVARDAFGYNLYYHNTDYAGIGANPFATTLQTNGALRQLFNGNIVASSVNIPQLTGSAYWLDKVYTYDQLNHIKSATIYHTVTTPVHNGDYDEQFTYDGNGNILKLKRTGAGTGTQVDDMTYGYNRNAGRLLNNRLNNVSGHAAASNITPDQAVNNYTYDAIGNLLTDAQSGTTGITWSVQGKILSAVRGSVGAVVYTYDVMGNRVTKTNGSLTTYYVRDPQGNPLAVYDNKNNTINWREQHLYGLSRLGMWTPNVALNVDPLFIQLAWDSVGKKQYELNNHLGNIMLTITDKRLQHTTNNTAIDYFTADVATAQDYYAFGSQMPGQTYNFTGNNYRYGFNGKENDNDVGKGIGNQQDYGMRIYDPRIAKFLSVDPLSTSYAFNGPYNFAEGNPISNVDLDGQEAKNSTSVSSLIGQGWKQGWQETKTNFKNTFSKRGIRGGINNAKASANTIVGMIKGDPNAYKKFSNTTTDLSLGLSNTIQNYTSKPILWATGIPGRSREENLRGIGYGLYKAVELYVFYKVPELGEGGEVFQKSQVDLMGGRYPSLGSRWLNYDMEARFGIADDVSNFSRHFGKNSVGRIIANNPQAEFLQSVSESLESGGTITVRGQMSNKYFKNIWNGKADGLGNFEVVPNSMKTGLSTDGYTRTDGTPLGGDSNSLNEITLKKK
jgi:RHS repeat-associated protein